MMKTAMIIVDHLVDNLLKSGYSLNLWDGDSGYLFDEWSTDKQALMSELASMELDHLYGRKEDKRGGGVQLVYENGIDVIVDYTIADKEFEVICDEAIKFANTLEDK